jgi:hypothetical protein
LANLPKQRGPYQRLELNMMKKTATAAPAPVLAADAMEAIQTEQGAALATKGKPLEPVTEQDLRANHIAAQAEKIQQKVLLLNTAKQSLAHAHDTLTDGESLTGEASRIADTASVSLYQARVGGLASAAEISALLGDVYGYKSKQDGSPGKTPAGQGEAIRKRIVRAVGAAEYATNGDGGKFFLGLPEDEIAQVVTEIDNGNCSIFTAYERFAEIKREHTSKTEQAFNPAVIAKIAEKLGEDGSAEILRSNPDLIAAYAALSAVLDVICKVDG